MKYNKCEECGIMLNEDEVCRHNDLILCPDCFWLKMDNMKGENTK